MPELSFQATRQASGAARLSRHIFVVEYDPARNWLHNCRAEAAHHGQILRVGLHHVAGVRSGEGRLDRCVCLIHSQAAGHSWLFLKGLLQAEGTSP